MNGSRCPKCNNCTCKQTCGRDSSLKRKQSSNKIFGVTSIQSSVTNSDFTRNSWPRQPKSGISSVAKVGSRSSRKSVLCPTNQNETVRGPDKLIVKRKSCPTKPFTPFCGEAPRVFSAPPLPTTSKKSNKAVTKAVRDYESGSVRNFVAVPYGVELYDENPQDDIRISRADFEALVSKAWAISEESVKDSQHVNGKSRQCTELNQPKFNSLKKSVRGIQEAISNLRLIPTEVENKVKNDPTYQRQIQETVTKRLNVPPTARMYKDLVQLDPSEAERIQSAEEILKAIRAVQPPPKAKDPEPNILDFNKPTFSRIRPKLPDPPAKPQTGVSLDIDDDFQLITSERSFTERGSNASLFDQQIINL